MIHNCIKELRHKRHVTQQELAEYLGMVRTSLSRIENMTHYPSPQTMEKVCEYFRMPLGKIFFTSTVSYNEPKQERRKNHG